MSLRAGNNNNNGENRNFRSLPPSHGLTQVEQERYALPPRFMPKVEEEQYAAPPLRPRPIVEEERYAAPPPRPTPIVEEERYALPGRVSPERPSQEEAPLPDPYGPNTDMEAVRKSINEIDYHLLYIDDNKKLSVLEKNRARAYLGTRKSLLEDYIKNPTKYELKRHNKYRINIGDNRYNGRLYPDRIYAPMVSGRGGRSRKTKNRSRKNKSKKASRKNRSK